MAKGLSLSRKILLDIFAVIHAIMPVRKPFRKGDRTSNCSKITIAGTVLVHDKRDCMQPCSNCMQTAISEADPGGGAWGAHVLSLGLSKHETQRFIMRLVHYLLQPSTGLYMNHCFKSCKLKSAAPKRQFCGNVSKYKG